MHIHISERDLKKIKFRFKLIKGDLNIKGYVVEKLKDKVCPDCLLKSFEKSETISVENLSFSRSCLCDFKVSPSISLKVNVETNPKITFA